MAAERFTPVATYDGVRTDDIARALSLTAVLAFREVTSTLDVANALANQGAHPGTLIIADSQTAGRGRHGRVWRSESGAGVWFTLLERPTDFPALDVLSLRVGIGLAPELDRLATDRVSLKWPNDLYVGNRKLGGILVEARWRESIPEWVGIGVGINVRAPATEARAIGLRDGVSRIDVLSAVLPAIRSAARAIGGLRPDELETFASRDIAAGRECVEPIHGVVQGIDESGALLVRVGSNTHTIRAGSLVLKEEQ